MPSHLSAVCQYVRTRSVREADVSFSPVLRLRRNERSQLTQIGSTQSEGVEDRENLIDAGGTRTYDFDTDRLRVPIEVNYDLRSDLFRPDNLLTR